MKIKDDVLAIDIVIERAKLVGLPVILATSTDSSDDVLENIAKNHQIQVFRGELENKIKRWYDCFNKFELSTAIEIDGDDLCYSYEMGRRALNEIQSKNAELLIAPSDTIVGLFTYAITRDAIRKLYGVAQNKETNTDVLTKFIEKANLKTDYVTTNDFECNGQMRLTLDYDEDLQFLRKLYAELDVLVSSREIVSYLKRNPEMCKINYHRHQDYLDNQAKFNSRIQ